jgi:hypothetical protein
VEDVVADGREVVLVLDYARDEAVAPQVARASVLPVEALREDAVQALHALREQLAARLQDEVVVVTHQAEDVHLPSEAPNDRSE